MPEPQSSAATTRSDAPRIGEYGYRGSGTWGYACSLCRRPFGPFATEAKARRYADLHTSECSRG